MFRESTCRAYIDARRTGEMIGIKMDLMDMRPAELAGLLGVSVQAVYKWMSGSSLPSLDNLVLLSSVLETPIDDLIVRKPLRQAGEDLCMEEDIVPASQGILFQELFYFSSPAPRQEPADVLKYAVI